MAKNWRQFDREHVWHPYTSLTNPLPTLPVVRAKGVEIELEDGRRLIDGMASWWSVIHGYNHPEINEAAKSQIDDFSHVMFGGLSHKPAADLCQKLVELTPQGLDYVFLSDSGSVAVDVAMKMAIQYWRETGQSNKQQFVALRGGYHGDTLGSMSICDPDTGMHHLFGDALAQQHFVTRPSCRFGESTNPQDIAELELLLELHGNTIAAMVVEPIVQGAGGMYFYSADYLRQAHALCKKHDVLFIADEIATGFARTGEMFACAHAGISPDILCLGKAMTGGYLSLAATLCNQRVAEGVCNGEAGVFMHGPTFMGNPLACSIANKSIDLLTNSNWRDNISRIEKRLSEKLAPLADHPKVADARWLGAIGVLETKEPVDMGRVQALLPSIGVWLRPFGNRVYTMPPYVIEDQQIDTIVDAMQRVVEEC